VASVGVLVDVDDVDDVPAAAGAPVQVHFPARLDAVVQHLRPVSQNPINSGLLCVTHGREQMFTHCSNASEIKSK
jgi:hypothetical protein